MAQIKSVIHTTSARIHFRLAHHARTFVPCLDRARTSLHCLTHRLPPSLSPITARNSTSLPSPDLPRCGARPRHPPQPALRAAFNLAALPRPPLLWRTNARPGPPIVVDSLLSASLTSATPNDSIWI